MPRLPPKTHNGGPPLDHVPEWGTAPIGVYFAWKSSRRQAFAAPPAVALIRARRAEACGVTVDEYAAHLLDTGRYLQPDDVDAIARIEATRNGDREPKRTT
jgi:hypothetical protein